MTPALSANIIGIAAFPDAPRCGCIRGTRASMAHLSTSRQAQGGNRRETAIARPDPHIRPAASQDAWGQTVLAASSGLSWDNRLAPVGQCNGKLSRRKPDRRRCRRKRRIEKELTRKPLPFDRRGRSSVFGGPTAATQSRRARWPHRADHSLSGKIWRIDPDPMVAFRCTAPVSDLAAWQATDTRNATIQRFYVPRQWSPAVNKKSIVKDKTSQKSCE